MDITEAPSNICSTAYASVQSRQEICQSSLHLHLDSIHSGLSYAGSAGGGWYLQGRTDLDRARASKYWAAAGGAISISAVGNKAYRRLCCPARSCFGGVTDETLKMVL
jgi:hypothetical protein